ncbi:MAG TPA: D-amino acid aminotransferase [Gammaproteobacteria bacterium]|nr:D-amino acid aminotransferase [Gammaproteobacteria bacterium]
MIVYLNNEFLPAEQACIPVLDRGFIFGDGVYEVIPAYGRRLFRLDEHLQRLHNSLTAVRIPNPLSREGWATMLNELIAQNEHDDQSLYLQVTRGSAQRDHAMPEEPVPTVFAMSNPLQPVSDSMREQGIAAITLDDIRWQRCHIKAISLLPNILLRQEALDNDAAEAILIRDGLATEGAASNLFIVSRGKLITPPTGPFLLPGITRDLILELAEANHIPFVEQNISRDELKNADEIWLTSSTKEILAVTRLDGEAVGGGKPGPLYQRMLALYQDYKQQLRNEPQ